MVFLLTLILVISMYSPRLIVVSKNKVSSHSSYLFNIFNSPLDNIQIHTPKHYAKVCYDVENLDLKDSIIVGAPIVYNEIAYTPVLTMNLGENLISFTVRNIIPYSAFHDITNYGDIDNLDSNIIYNDETFLLLKFFHYIYVNSDYDLWLQSLNNILEVESNTSNFYHWFTSFLCLSLSGADQYHKYAVGDIPRVVICSKSAGLDDPDQKCTAFYSCGDSIDFDSIDDLRDVVLSSDNYNPLIKPQIFIVGKPLFFADVYYTPVFECYYNGDFDECFIVGFIPYSFDIRNKDAIDMLGNRNNISFTKESSVIFDFLTSMFGNYISNHWFDIVEAAN